MCGLSGIFDLRGGRPVDRDLLQRMNDAVAHRGPDGDGFHVEPGLGLGHRRLAIIDLKTGDQPIYSDDGRAVIFCNGEIYNFKDLRRELQGLGHRFHTAGDIEVALKAWLQWGEACVERLRGMFAIVIWDASREVLFLARDRLGKKPLYYAETPDGRLLFGSELKCLLQDPALPREIDLGAVEDYFAYGYVPDPKTIYAGMHKLPPACHLTVRRGAPVPAPRAYWTLRFTEDGPADEGEACEDLIARLREAVDIRRVSDVPIGAFLSGGVDSSAVVAMMAQVSPEPVNTFSIGFRQKAFDESDYAAAHARRYGTKHFSRIVDADEFDLVDRLAAQYDEPFGDSSALPTYRVSTIARERVTVSLSGDGGDEFFAGYRRYLWHVSEERVRRMLPDGARRGLFGFLGRAYPKLDWAPRALRARTTFQELSLDPADAFFHSVSRLHDGLRHSLYSAGFRRRLGGYHAAEHLRRCFAEADSDVPLLQAQAADLKTWLPGDILVKADRASMAASLEARAPLLDHELVEWSARLPARLKLNGRTGKYILKKALEPHVAHDILYRPKMGFSVPLAKWFRGPLRERVREAATGAALAETGFFDMAFLRQLVDRHQSGLSDHGDVLWSVLMFDSFLRQVHGLQPSRAQQPARAVGAA